MPALRLKRASAGPTDVGVPNTNASRLESLVNGGLSDINLAANFPVDVVAAVANLTDREGRMGMVSAGGHYVRVVHDGEKYVSRETTLFRQQEDHEAGTEDLPRDAFPRLLIPGYKAIYDAGLRAQLRVGGCANRAAIFDTISATVTVTLYELDDDDEAVGASLGAASLVFSPSSIGFRIGEWETLTAAPSAAHAVCVAANVNGIVVGGSDAPLLSHLQAVMRWIYEP